jgi:hypothetical protein
VVGPSAQSLLTEKEILQNPHKTLLIILVVIALTFVVLTRAIPYINHPANHPIAYDAESIATDLARLESNEAWIAQEPSPRFHLPSLPFRASLKLTLSPPWLHTLNSSPRPLTFYLAKTKYDTKTGLIALALFALSLVQFKVFEYLYFKNVIALAFAFFSIAFFLKFNKSQNKTFLWIAIALGAAVGTIHPPTFYIFAFIHSLHIFSPNEKTTTKKTKAKPSRRYHNAHTANLPTLENSGPNATFFRQSAKHHFPENLEFHLLPIYNSHPNLSSFRIPWHHLTLNNDWKKDHSVLDTNFRTNWYTPNFLLQPFHNLLDLASLTSQHSASAAPSPQSQSTHSPSSSYTAGGYSVLNSSSKPAPALQKRTLEITPSSIQRPLVMVISAILSWFWVTAACRKPNNCTRNV